MQKDPLQKNSTSGFGIFPVDQVIPFLGWSFLLIPLLTIVYYQLQEGINLGYFLGNLSDLIFFLLLILYFEANKFYKDKFLFLIAIGWGTIGVQNYFNVTFENKLLNGFLSVVNLFPFYVASKLSINSPSYVSKISLGLLFWIVQILGTALIITSYSRLDFPAGLYVAQIPFSFWTFFLIGREITHRFNFDPISRWAAILSVSYYFYGALQIIFLLRYLNLLSTIFLPIVFVGMLIKLINAVSLSQIVTFEFERVTDQRVQQSVFEDIGVITASIEHEMRNPLMVLQTDIQRMRLRFQHNEDLLSFVDQLEKQADRIYNASQIVTFLRKDDDSATELMKKEDVEVVVRRTIKLLKKTADTSNIYIKIHKTKTVYARIFSSMFEQALLNILNNAIEAIREAKRNSGQIDIQIIASYPENHLFSINIKDNGCGISKEDIPKLTTIFSTKGNQKLNSGIGLFICKRIIKIHEGQLKITSKIGEETVVSIILPKWSTEPYEGKR